MNRRNAFWDSSALVPLCVPQAFSPKVRELLNHYSVTIWWATPVEIAGAAARLLRVQDIGTDTWKDARRYEGELAQTWRVIAPSDEVRDSAIDLVDRYDVHAADSLQLAAALEWCEGNPRGEIFITLDNRLRDAALLCGFDAPKI